MRFGCALLASALAFAVQAFAKSSTGDSILVILQPDLKREDYSIYFKNLERQGYELTFRAPADAEPRIIIDDEPAFNHIVFFAPETKAFAPDITPQSLVNLLAQKVNIIVALSPKQTPLYTFASEFGLILPPPNTPLLSHFPKRDGPPTVIPIPTTPSPLLSKPKLRPIWFKGIPHALSNNPLLFPVLRAPAESFATDTDVDSGAEAILESTEKGGEGLWAGSSLGVVTGFQTKVNSRIMFVGGVELFSNEFMNKPTPNGDKSGNEIFAKDISAWTFKETLCLRLDATMHHHANATDLFEEPEFYTTNDMVTFEALIFEYDPSRGRWKPKNDLEDLQLEFTMLDPHIRIALLPNPEQQAKYEVTFRVPDRHGVFKFVVDYKRPGYSFLESSTTVPVVPPRHDGYPRFLSAAWPYYAGAISTSAGFVIFAALWLAGDDRAMRKGGKAGKTE